MILFSFLRNIHKHHIFLSFLCFLEGKDNAYFRVLFHHEWNQIHFWISPRVIKNVDEKDVFRSPFIKKINEVRVFCFALCCSF